MAVPQGSLVLTRSLGNYFQAHFNFPFSSSSSIFKPPQSIPPVLKTISILLDQSDFFSNQLDQTLWLSFFFYLYYFANLMMIVIYWMFTLLELHITRVMNYHVAPFDILYITDLYYMLRKKKLTHFNLLSDLADLIGNEINYIWLLLLINLIKWWYLSN